MTFASDARAAVVAAVMLVCGVPVLGQTYPTRPIRMVVPNSPGAGTDLIARLLAQRFHTAFGQVVTVENRPGAGGNIGAELVAKSTPDGHTLLMATASIAVNVSLYTKLPFDARTDLVPITQVGSTPLVVCVHPSTPARTLKELIALSKTTNKGLNFGSNGTGSTSHLAGIMLAQTSGLRLTHVPYKGAAAQITALLTGEVEMGVVGVVTLQPQIRAGKLRGIAVTTKRRSPVLPDLPTIDSSYPGFDIDNWWALFAPAGTPQIIVNRIQTEVAKALEHPDLKAYMSREGAEPVGSTPGQFAAFFKAEVDKFARIVKISGAKPDS